jgi:polyisoprenoid-binding protein YceI
MSVLQNTSESLLSSGSWQIDTAHSSVEFACKHLMIATVKGRFREFAGTIDLTDNPLMLGAIRAETLDTHDPQRDAHLRSPDFLDVARYPEIRFESTRLELGEGEGFLLLGDLTIKNVTREITLGGVVQGTAVDSDGNERLALELRGEFDRNEFGLTWNHALETGGLLVGNTVRLAIDVSAVRAG